MNNQSLRVARLRARAPRALLTCAVVILCAAGLRAVIAGPSAPVVVPARTVTGDGDQGARAFAEGFVRAYLTWDGAALEQREQALAPYLADDLDSDGGAAPGTQTKQRVVWTAVLGSHRSGERDLVTVAAQTTRDLVYVDVPVSRNDRGFLAVSAYPAFIGPPATDPHVKRAAEEQVADVDLKTVVTRALTNYLSRTNRNLLADLTPGAVVSLPPQTLEVTDVVDVNWVAEPRRVAITVNAIDARKVSWTLRYEVDIVRRDRWYVQSLEVDPTFKGGR